MKKVFFVLIGLFAGLCHGQITIQNPIMSGFYPDPSITRVGDDFYMTASSFNCIPGLPILHSKDLVNWKIVSYAYDVLDSSDALALNNGKVDYGRGSWASCLRLHKGIYYLSTFSGTTGKTNI